MTRAALAPLGLLLLAGCASVDPRRARARLLNVRTESGGTAVRPEKIDISKQKPALDKNLFTGKVKEIAYFGSYNTYIVLASDGSRVRITEANTSRHGVGDITWEDDVYFWWNDDAAVVLRD